MGGIIAKAADESGIHFRLLNTSKGAATRSTRIQTDRMLYKQAILKAIRKQKYLTILQQSVKDLIIKNHTILGCITELDIKIYSKTLILCTGTFLGGIMHIGNKNKQGGRAGDKSTNILSQRLRSLPFRIGRLKTGTPPRIDSKSINYNLLMEQYSDQDMNNFSVWKKK